MARAISVEMSHFFSEQHTENGIKFDFRQGLARIIGQNGRVAGVETTDGRRLEADIVLVGIGILPNVRLAAEAGLDIHNGIKVDGHMLTSDPTISAIGDVASFPSEHAEGLIRLESVQNATDQARHVAARLAGKSSRVVGKSTSYDALPWFWTDQGDLKLQIAGLSNGYDDVVSTRAQGSKSFSVMCFRRGQLVAVESVNSPADHMAARRLLGRSAALSPAEAASEGFDIKAWEIATR
jgi:NADPH-dependent 2,4-dienoyl-CoA reductase/sulfur reductase-like enzyme